MLLHIFLINDKLKPGLYYLPNAANNCLCNFFNSSHINQGIVSCRQHAETQKYLNGQTGEDATITTVLLPLDLVMAGEQQRL